MSSSDTPNDGTPQKIWSVKDPYRYPVPQSEDSDPWDTSYQVLVKEDDVRCDAWRKEIQNLLIFAGLFSGVVTAFVLDSYKSLQPDPSETTNFLLAQLVSQSSGQSSPPAFVAKPSSTRLNVFWFLSLILALATVLIGITAMQWLSEYQRYSGTLTKKENLAQRNMRFEGLKEWYVPQIIAGLPLLLQGALALFFAGMIEFLNSLADRALTISVTTVMAITLLFMVMTTVLPALQHIWLEVGVCSTSVSPPCPYKSPQSWAFLRIAFSHTAHVIWAIGVIIVYTLLIIPSSLYRACTQSTSTGLFDSRFSYVKQVFTWDQFERHWLDIRNFHGLSLSRSPRPFPPPSEYDAARGVARVVNQRVLDDKTACAAYNCFKQLKVSALGNTFFSVFWEGAPDGGVGRGSLLSPAFFLNQQSAFVRDESAMLFLAQFPQTLHTDAEHVFVKHQLELYIRICTFLFAGDSFHVRSDSAKPLTVAPLVPRSLDGWRQDGKLLRGVGAVEKSQLVNIFATLVHRVISNAPVDDDDVTRFYLRAHGPLHGFIYSIHSILVDALISAPPSPSSFTPANDQTQAQTVISQFSHTIQNLASHLETAQPGHSLLALSIASSYLWQLWQNGFYSKRHIAFHYQRYPVYVRSMKALYDASRSFSEKFGPDAVVGVLDGPVRNIPFEEALLEKQGRREESGEKGYGSTGGLDPPDEASVSQVPSIYRDHDSGRHDPSTMV